MSLTDSMRIIDAPNDDTFWNDDSAADKAPKICAEPGCTNPTGETPTGRRAKFCDEHKDAKNRSGNAPKGSPRGRKRSTWPQKEAVRASLNQLVMFAGGGLSVLNRVDGKIVMDGGPNLVTALVDLAEEDKSIRRYLDFLSKPGKYGPLVLASAAIVIPILANHNLLPQFFLPSGEESNGATNPMNGGVSE